MNRPYHEPVKYSLHTTLLWSTLVSSPLRLQVCFRLPDQNLMNISCLSFEPLAPPILLILCVSPANYKLRITRTHFKYNIQAQLYQYSTVYHSYQATHIVVPQKAKIN